jgi:hypothetical protein
MNVRRTGWQIENLAQKLHLCFDFDIASTGSRYYRFVQNSEDSFTVRVSDHGQVYGNPKFSIDSTGDDTYKSVKQYLIDLAKRECEWEKENN